MSHTPHEDGAALALVMGKQSMEWREQLLDAGDGTAPAAQQPPDFVLALLTELRAHNYAPLAWGRFLLRSWGQSQATARAHPRLVRSWLGVTLGLGLAEAAALAVTARWGSHVERRAAMRAAPFVAASYAFSQFDAYVHLGLNTRSAGDPLHEEIGLPTTLTLIRRAVADYLWGRLCVGRPVAPPVALAALLTACATDIADGAVARATNHQTRLGAYLDAEADLSFWLALALTLAARRRLPRSLVALLVGRFLAPFAGALASYFGWVRRLPIGSTITGKAAGIAQTVVIGSAVLPTPARRKLAPSLPWLYALTTVLLLAAPLAQFVKLARNPTGK